MLSLAGGKATSLSSLLRVGFPVPDGFAVTTEAYRGTTGGGLAEWIVATAESAPADDPHALDVASKAIRDRMAAEAMPEAIVAAVQRAYRDLGAPPVAVRSSATTEDLPDLSFAGQQETVLNVLSQRAVVEAVVRCWSSVWTARAIGYRSRNRIAHADVAIAVVVQRCCGGSSPTLASLRCRRWSRTVRCCARPWSLRACRSRRPVICCGRMRAALGFSRVRKP